MALQDARINTVSYLLLYISDSKTVGGTMIIYIFLYLSEFSYSIVLLLLFLSFQVR